jgi:hypothetical protein
MKGDDILSLVFLVLVCIVISSLVIKLVPNMFGLLVPSISLIFVGLFIAYDYMLKSRQQKREDCMEKTEAMASPEERDDAELNDLLNQINNSTSDAPVGTDTKETIPEPVKQRDDEFDISIYLNPNDSMKRNFSHYGSDADNMICNRNKYMGVQAQLSKNIRSAFNVNSVKELFEDELEMHSQREWWGNSDFLDVHM